MKFHTLDDIYKRKTLSKRKFELGMVVVTNDVKAKMEINPSFSDFVYMSLHRFSQCDWGDIPEENKRIANEHIKKGPDECENVLAVYEHKKTKTKILIVVEFELVTTVLFPYEY